MASRAELTAWTDEASGKKFVQIEGTIYEQLGAARPDRRPPGSGAIGWGDVPEDPRLADGWQDAGTRRGKRCQAAVFGRALNPLKTQYSKLFFQIF